MFNVDPVRVVKGKEEQMGKKVLGPDGTLRIQGDEKEMKEKTVIHKMNREGNQTEVEKRSESNDDDSNDDDSNDDDSNDDGSTSEMIAGPSTTSVAQHQHKQEKGVVRGKRPRAVGIDCGFAHTAALDSEGSLWIWGKFLSRTLSEDGTRHADQFTPRRIDGIDDHVIDFTCGQFHTTALGASGRMWIIGMKSKSEMEEGSAVIDRFQITEYHS